MSSPPEDARLARAVLAVVFSATILIGLNATMLSVALPSVVGELDATPLEGSWMLLSYLVVAGAGLVLSGQLADCLDLGRVFRAGLAAFGFSALTLALANDTVVFIAARAVQGAGAALLLSTAAALITVTSPVHRRQGAMGIYLAGFAIAQVSGPMIGGLVTDTVGWRWLFVIGFVVGVGTLTLGWRTLSRLPARPSRGLRVDVVGNVLIFLMTSLLLVAFAGVQDVGWTSPRTIGALAATAVAIPAFVAVERRSRWPAIAVDLLRDRAFALANAAGFCLCVGRIVPAVVFSLWFQGYAGDDPLTAAVKITPLAVAVTVGTLTISRVARSWDDVLISRAAAATSVVGSALLLGSALGAPVGLLPAGLVVLGLATGAFQTVNSTMILGMRPLGQVGTVNGIRATAQQTAVSLGTALLLSLGVAGLEPSVAGHFYAGRHDALSAQAREVLVHGHVVSMSVLVGLCLAGLLAVSMLRRPSRLHGT